MHQHTNEIHVMRILNDTNTNFQYIKDYKKVDKDDFKTKLEGMLYVDCAY